ncbi:MAG TPA: alpha/beta fold hydrolase [Geobacteraceae bacterium]|nr:alpha/beta fold hydrolase [Geobacteraceae bacterium]
MNRYAYLATGQAIRMVSTLSAANVLLHGSENIPRSSVIFAVNHFTRIETLLMPVQIYDLTGVPVWSLADYRLFEGPLAGFLDRIGVVSTKAPDRNLLIMKTLLTGEANWVIYPEGQMVKDKRIGMERGPTSSPAANTSSLHTGAAVLALRTEFYRQRLHRMASTNMGEVQRLIELLRIEHLKTVLNRETWIVPVNITYYPLRAHENILSRLATRFLKNISQRTLEEIMTEGSMLLSGVDIDISFGKPIAVKEYLVNSAIEQDISARKRIDFDDPISARPKLQQMALDLTRDYMSAIYRMTTVNHDHLFSSMLKMVASPEINEGDLKRRVFLVTVGDLDKIGVAFHRSLLTSQVSLLTDDRFNKYREFITLAIKKGVIRKEGKALILEKSKLSSPFDIHSVRIDNPVAVIANEVAPLVNLQREIRDIARLTPLQLRRRIAEYLMQKGDADFRADYDAFFSARESKPPEVGAPYLIKGKTREIGVVLIHGFMAAPCEMRELADYLGRRGVWVYALRLRGHGTSPEDLARRTCHDWIESVDEGYSVVSNLCRQVVVGGFSIGGGLALDLASRVPTMAGVFAVCPPLRFQDLSSRFAPAVGLWNRLMDIAHYDTAKKRFLDISPEHPHQLHPPAGCRHP